MGVTLTYSYTGKNLLEEQLRLQTHLEIMQACEKSAWNITISVMYHKNIEQNPCALYLVSFPTTQVAVVNKATEDQFELLQGDMNLLNFIENIQSLKIRQQFIVMGNEYEVGDFRIRLGLASISNETKFLILEIEFIAINIKSCGQPCINEFKGYLDPESKLKETSIEYYKYFKLNSEEFTAKHSAIDMLLSLNCLDIK